MEYKRADRVADLILKELADILLRKVKDPRVVGITLTDVEVSSDLQRATVFYSLLSNEEGKASTAAGLKSARGFLKRELSKRLQMRRMPEIDFRFDGSLEYGSRIDRLLNDLGESEKR